ncbi:MAG: AAA family ATPase [Spirochaetota bacterium]
MNSDGIKGHQRQIKNLEFLLQNGKIPQVVLFTGCSGIGKKLIAKKFLNALFCKSKNPPCLTCSVCKQIEHDTFPDFIELHPNEKGIIPIGTEEYHETGTVRWLIEKLAVKSISGKIGVLIDGIDRIGEEGQNALLKTIEEPSQDSNFILITSNKNNLLPTILSRCTEIRFFPLSVINIRELIFKDNFLNLSESEMEFIVEISGGSLDIAGILADSDLFNKIIQICQSIFFSISEDKVIDVDLAPFQNKIKTEILLDIIINIFRLNLIKVIRKDTVINHELSGFFIKDEKKILNLLKALILLKKNEAYNLNFKYALKGLLYSL